MLKWIIPLWKSHLLCWSHGVSFLLLHQPVVLQAGEWRAVIGWHMHTPTHILLHKGVVQANDAWTDEGMQRLWLHSLHLHISSSDSCFIVQFFSSWCFLFPAAVFFPLPPPSLPLLYAPPHFPPSSHLMGDQSWGYYGVSNTFSLGNRLFSVCDWQAERFRCANVGQAES